MEFLTAWIILLLPFSGSEGKQFLITPQPEGNYHYLYSRGTSQGNEVPEKCNYCEAHNRNLNSTWSPNIKP